MAMASDSDADSDYDLQDSFAKGQLKPGLHQMVPHVKKNHIYNATGMKQKLEDFKSPLEWLERLDFTINKDLTPFVTKSSTDFDNTVQKKNQASIPENSVHNDFAREVSFYQLAQTAVLQGIPKLKQLGIPTKRPNDYFAQMAKTDAHMEKVREKLLSKQVALERSEKAKKLRELKKHGKQIQHEATMDKQKKRKELLESIKKYRKGQTDNLDFLEDSKMAPKKPGRQPSTMQKNKKPQMKRSFKDVKYGYGGRKKRSKYNTADSSAFLSSNKGKKSKNPQRPGKQRRRQMRRRR